MNKRQSAVNQRNKAANFQKDVNAAVRKRQLEAEAALKGDQAALNDPFIRYGVMGDSYTT